MLLLTLQSYPCIKKNGGWTNCLPTPFQYPENNVSIYLLRTPPRFSSATRPLYFPQLLRYPFGRDYSATPISLRRERKLNWVVTAPPAIKRKMSYHPCPVRSSNQNTCKRRGVSTLPFNVHRPVGGYHHSVYLANRGQRRREVAKPLLANSNWSLLRNLWSLTFSKRINAFPSLSAWPKFFGVMRESPFAGQSFRPQNSKANFQRAWSLFTGATLTRGLP